MELFENYIDDIDKIINRKNISSYKKYSYDPTVLKSLNERRNFSKAQDTGISQRDNSNKTLVKFDYSSMSNLFGIHKFSVSEPTIGNHPDFSHLSHSDYENHYAVSMFLDIKGSTELSKKYDLLQIRLIKDTILTLAIHVCSFFGGHIQRLQGDGVFVYFVRREQHRNDAIINSLNASSMMCFFMKYIMTKIFQKEGIEPLKVRIGIDYGDDEQVLWSYYGLTACNELTTTSLHTDLASKLQSEAKSNGILLGDNVVKKLDIRDSLISFDINDRTVFSNYNKFDFKWEDYLRTFNFIQKNPEGELIIDIPKYALHCMIAENQNSIYFPYHQNLFSIPKGYKIKFEVKKDNLIYNKSPYEEIEWKIKNTGKEAKEKNGLSPDISANNNKPEAIVDAVFLGQHDMECKIKRQHLENINLRYSVFVQ
jgi:adenylate cyclase